MQRLRLVGRFDIEKRGLKKEGDPRNFKSDALIRRKLGTGISTFRKKTGDATSPIQAVQNPLVRLKRVREPPSLAA